MAKQARRGSERYRPQTPRLAHKQRYQYSSRRRSTWPERAEQSGARGERRRARAVVPTRLSTQAAPKRQVARHEQRVVRVVVRGQAAAWRDVQRAELSMLAW